MSALGHKQTYAVRNGMSALPPKADMCVATRDVRFGPIADIGSSRQLRATSAVPMALGNASLYRDDERLPFLKHIRANEL